MKNDILNDLVLSAAKRRLHILNVVVRQDGDIIARHDFEAERAVLLYSVSKTFTSMAVGIAASEGCFSLKDPLLKFFPGRARARNEYLEMLSVHDLLCMGTGHAECPVSKADWSTSQAWDICDLFFDEPIVYRPGTHFTYDNSATYMLSKLISIATGTPLDAYLDERIFQPLGIPRPEWDTCPLGVPQGFSGLHLTASQLSMCGQLVLDKGVWEGRQLIPSAYIEQAASVQIPTRDFDAHFATADYRQGYGYQMWMNSYPGSYRMDGLYGQYVVMLPDKNAVVTFVSNEPKNMTGILELTWDSLIDKL